MEGRRILICGLPARGVKPQLQQQRQEEATEDQGSDDVQEITELEYRRSLAHRGYLIRIEEDEEDIHPMYRAFFRNLQNSARNSTEQGQSSRGKARRRD